MSGLKKEIRSLTEKDKAIVLQARQRRLLGFVFAFLASISIICYAVFGIGYSSVLFLPSLLLILALGNVYILLKEYKDLGDALVKGEKDVFCGVVFRKYSKAAGKGYTGYDYFVLIKDDQERRKERKRKINQLKETFMKTEDENALNEYEAMIAAGNDNDPIRIQPEDFEKIKAGDRIEFHCISSVYLSSRIFNKNTSLHGDLGSDNFFRLYLLTDHSDEGMI